MKIKDIPYYVNFVFSGSDETCFSTADRELLKKIVFNATGNTVMDIRIGDVIRFTPNPQAYKITDIRVRQLVEDTEVFNYGFDSEGCTEISGVAKEWLFSILFSMEPA